MPLLRPSSTPFSRLSPTLSSRLFSTTASRPMAKISVIGRLASTPEVLPTSTGNDVVRYALATGHGPKDNRYTSWWKVAAFPADNSVVKDILLSLGKGSLVYLEGSCSMGKFTDKNGNQQSSLNIVQRQLEIIERRDPSDGDSLAPAEGE